jgi:disulfide bond formation protein DsbB
MEETSKKSWTIHRLYLLVASLVGLIGGLISIGIALSSVAEKVIITDHEYVYGQNYYELQQCKEGYYYGKTDPKDSNRKPSTEQKATCESEKSANLILQRQVNFKQSILGG